MEEQYLGFYRVTRSLNAAKLFVCKNHNTETYYRTFGKITIPENATVVGEKYNDLRTNQIIVNEIKKNNKLDKCYNLYYKRSYNINDQEYEEGKTYNAILDEKYYIEYKDTDIETGIESYTVNACKPGIHFMLSEELLKMHQYKEADKHDINE